jgi:hypothetical protein
LASVKLRECYLLENFIYLNWSMMLIGHFPAKRFNHRHRSRFETPGSPRNEDILLSISDPADVPYSRLESKRLQTALSLFTMRPFGFLVAALALLPGALAVDESKSVIVWYEDHVGDAVIEQAKQAIVAAGGQITHVYSLIKGFSAIAPVMALETIQTFSTDCHVEEDGEVTTLHNRRHS